MTCTICKSELLPVMYNGDIEVAWVCECIVVIRVSSSGYEYGSRIWRSTEYIQGAKCQTTRPK